jgi:hypothetical protein
LIRVPRQIKTHLYKRLPVLLRFARIAFKVIVRGENEKRQPPRTRQSRIALAAWSTSIIIARWK